MLSGSKFIVWRHEGEAADWGEVRGQREMGSYYQQVLSFPVRWQKNN